MSFAKAPLKRFTDLPPSDVPGPGAYGLLKSPPQLWKKGILAIEQTERFHEGPSAPDTFGLYNPDFNHAGTGAGKENKRSRPSTNSTALNPEKAKQQMDDLRNRLQQSHEKDLARLQARLAKTEQSRQDLAKEKSDAKVEVATLKHEIKTLTTRESTIKSQLEKSEASLQKHSASLPLLQKKLEELSKSHSDSRARKDVEISNLNSELVKLKESISTKDDELKVAREGEEEARIRLEAMKDVENAFRRILQELKEKEEKANTLLTDKLSESETVILKLQRRLGDKDAILQALTGYTAALEEELDLLKNDLSEREGDLNWSLGELRWEREEGKRSDKEWRQRARSDGREIVWLREDVAFEVEVGRVERDCEKAAFTSEEEKKVDAMTEADRLNKELEIVEGELDLAINEEIPRLEAERDEDEVRIDALEETVADKNEIITNMEVEKEELRDAVQKMKGELEEISLRLGEREKEVEKERLEKKRLVSLLGQSRAAEAGLKEELECVSNALAQLQSVKEQHSDLVRHLDELARRNALAESDVRELGELNIDLLSHNNANQKIRHVAAIRADLAESRRNHLSTTSQLATTQRENEALKAELDSYRSVSSFPCASSTRSRVGRPKLDDVYSSLDEGEHVEFEEQKQEGTENEMLPPLLPLAPGGTGGRSGLRISLASVVEEDVFAASRNKPGGGRRAGKSVVATTAGEIQRQSIRMQGRMELTDLF